MKKIIAIILACALMIMVPVSAFAANFPDLQASRWDWARDTVVELAQKGIVKGYSDGTYQPEKSVTNQEAFTLFARIIGVNDEINKEAVEAAQTLYSHVAQKYNTYATKELCYMLYRGIFTEAQLDAYLSEETKDLPMKRHEAAVLITKIMGGQKEVENTVIYVFDYTDADTIPATSKGYIDFVKKKGIMQGMEDNTFSPNTSVTRAQIAIMLKKTMTAMSMTTASGMISSIDEEQKTFVLNGQRYALTDETTVNLDGEHVEFAKLSVGDEAIVTVGYNGLWAIDAIKSGTQSMTIDAVFKGSYNDTKGTFIKAYEMGADDSQTKEYKLSENVTYTHNGVAAPLSNFSLNDRVFITLSDGLVTALRGESKTKTITDARVVEIVLDSVPSLEITHASMDYDGKTYEIDSDVTVKKNNKKSSLRNILPGDMITLTLEYDVINSIEAFSQLSTTNGTIEEITIGRNISSIEILSNDKSASYAIVRDTEILVDGKSATIYDLRIGYTVGVNIESDTVTKIDVHSVAQAKSVTGTVSLVNVSLGFINLNVIDANGNISAQQVFVKDETSIIGSSSARKKDLEDLSVGDTLMITGEVNMGAFEAGTIILLEK